MTTSRRLAVILFLLDGVSMAVVFNVIGSLRGIDIEGDYLGGVLAVPFLLTFVALSLIDGYKSRTDMLGTDYASEHCIALIASMLSTLLATYVAFTTNFPLQSSRLVTVLSFLTLMPLTLGYRRLLQMRQNYRHWNRSIVYLGEASGWQDFSADYVRHRTSNPLLFCDISPSADQQAEAGSSIPLKPLFEDIAAGNLEIEAIVLEESRTQLSPDFEHQLVQMYFKGVPTYTLELFHQTYWRKYPLPLLNKSWLFREGFHIAREPMVRQVKRATDISAAVIGLLVSSPLILLAIVAIWLEDRGPVFFRQTRMGKDDKPFSLYKLRSMRHQPPAPAPGDCYTRQNDPRITRVGRLLRASRLDEFPQLWNVLKGEMSLIGPRAEWDLLVAGYDLEIPHYRFRHLVKPGITGWAQVNYPYGTSLEDARRKLEYDLFYIRHYSLKLDATITLKTLHVMLFGKGQ